MKYFRNYPWGLQLMLLLLMVFTFLSLAAVCIYAFLPAATGITVDQIRNVNEHSPYSLIRISQISIGLSSLFVFFIPSLIFTYLTHPDVKQYLGLRRPGKAIQPLLAVLVILGALPVLTAISELVSHLDLGGDILKEQEANDRLFSAYLTMPAFADFARTFLIMAIIPAVGEELFFRGLLMRFTVKASKSLSLGIVFTSVIFAYSHTNIYGLISISMAGAILAGIYYLTGSLWCSMLAHMCFNGLQIVLAYAGNTNAAVKSFENSNTTQGWLVAAGAAVFAVASYLLLRWRTPLPPAWTEDFDRPAFDMEAGEEEQ